MKKIFAIFLLISILFVSGCDTKTYYWQFERDYTEVQEISIINDRYSNEMYNSPRIKTLESSQYESFYNEVQNLEMKKPFRTNLNFKTPEGYCFLIKYNEYFYCVLSEIGSGHIIRKRENVVYSWSKLDFNEEDFLNLINKYLETDN